MIRLQINPAFSDLLQSNYLSAYAEIMQTDAGETVEDNEQRDVRRLRLNGQVLYLKRTKSEKSTSAIESYARARLAHSKPVKEMLQFKCLAEHGFDVAEVVACGEQLCLGIPQRGFIITAEVSGEDLAGVFRAAGESDRILILGQFGALLGRLHARGFYGSTRLKDIIYAGRPDVNPMLTLIDRETRNPYPKRVSAKRIVERLLFNIRRQAQQGEIFSEREWHAFCENYCASMPRASGIQLATLQQRILDSLRTRSRKSVRDAG